MALRKALWLFHSAKASAASQPFGASLASPVGVFAASAIASMIWTLQPISSRRFATSPTYLRPASSASGQILTKRPAKGLQSVFPAALAPPEDVVATTPL